MSSEFASLQNRLQDLNESIQQTISLIQHLAKLQPQTNGLEPTDGLPAADSSLETVTDLSAEIHDVLKQQEEDLALLKQDVDDETTPQGFGLGARRGHYSDKGNALGEGCEALAEDLKSVRTRFRAAQLQAKRNADVARQHERDTYLASLRAAAESMSAAAEETPEASTPPTSSSTTSNHLTPHAALSAEEARKLLLARRSPRPGGQRDPNATQADLALTATSNITSSLRRTHALLTSELSRSAFAQETFDASNAALSELNTRYSNLDDLLTKSRGLLSTLLRSQKSDTWYLETAMWMLAGTIAWLIFRRLLYGPLWWFVWFPTRLFFRVVFSITGGVLSLVTGTVGGAYGLVLGAGPSTALAETASTSLRIMPSTIGKPQSRSSSVIAGAYVPVVGSSGAGTEETELERSPAGSMSDVVGRMVEAASAAGLDGSETEMPLATEMAYAASVAGLSDFDTALPLQPIATQQPEQHHQPQQDQGETTDEQSQARQQQAPAGQAQEQVVRRADGQALRERDPVREPPNRKKRMFEEPPPARSTKGFGEAEVRDEL